MIIENNRTELLQAQINQYWEEINERHRAIEQLENAKRQPVEWQEQTTIRIILDNEDVVRLTINAKTLIDYLFESDITAVKVDGKVYVYVNFILPQHQEILLQYGAEIETNQNQ